MAVETSKMFFIDFELESDERYDLGKFLQWVDDNHDPLTSNLFENIKKIKSGGLYTIQGDGERPDNISFKIYGSTEYWWVILLYNGITEYNSLPNGKQINYPNLQALEDFYFSLKIKQDKQDKET